MERSNRLRVAVIGMGLIGNRHAWAYERHPQVDIVGVCDTDPERAAQGATRFGCQHFTAFEEVATRADIDLVSVCTPDPFHVEPILAMLRAGKHVLAEKPLTLSYAEAKLLVDEAARRDLVLSVRLPQRHVAEHRRMRSLIASGRLGEFVAGSVRSLIPITMPTTLPWASLTDLHWLYHQHRYDLVRWLIGVEAVEVFARGQRRVLVERGIDCYDSIQATVTYANGASIVYDTSWINPPGWHRRAITLDLLFTNGRMSSAPAAEPSVALLSANGHNGSGPGAVPDALGATGELPENQWRPVQEVAEAILHGTAPPVTADDALTVMALLEATDRSLRSGGVVAIRDVIAAPVVTH